MLDILPIFYTPLAVVGEQYKMSEKEIEYIKNLELSERNKEGNHTTKDKYIFSNEQLKYFKNYCTNYLNEYTREILGIKNVNFYITQSWANFNNKNEAHHLHSHQNSIISGVFYLDNKGGNIKFIKKNFLEEMNLSFNYNNTDYFHNEFEFKIEKNTLILFPSNVEHKVEINNEDDTRISIAFNSYFEGKLGEYNSANELSLTK